MLDQIKKSAILILALPCLLQTSISQAHSFCFEPYIGIGIQNTSMKGGKGVSQAIPDREKFYPKNYIGGSALAGFKFHQHFGLEFGYESTKQKKRLVQMDGNTVHLGDPEDPTAQIDTRISLQTLYVDLTAYAPIWKKLNLLFSMGVSRKISNVSIFQRYFLDPVEKTLQYTALPLTVDKKTLLRLGLGIEYEIVNNLGLRAKALFEDTSSIQAIPTDEYSNIPFPGYYSPFRKSVSFLIALIGKF